MSKLVRRSIETLAARPLDPQEVRLRPAPFWSQALVWTIIGTASAGFVFAVLAQIDEVVVAPGMLQPRGAERPIKSPLARGSICLRICCSVTMACCSASRLARRLSERASKARVCSSSRWRSRRLCSATVLRRFSDTSGSRRSSGWPWRTRCPSST